MSEREPPEVGKSSIDSRDVIVFEKVCGTKSCTFVGKTYSRVFYRLQIAGSPTVIRYGLRYRRVHEPAMFPEVIAKFLGPEDRAVVRRDSDLDVSKPCSTHFVVLEERHLGHY